MLSSTLLILTHGNFSTEVLQSPQPVLVYFWAEWCSRCCSVGPVLDQLAQQYANRIKICTVNIDEQPGLAAEYGVRAIPTVVVLRNGQVAEQVVGPTTRHELENSMDHVFA